MSKLAVTRLNVVVVFQDFDQAHKFLRAVKVKFGRGVGFPDQLGAFAFAKIGLERG